MTKQIPSFDAFADAKRFFIENKDGDKFPMRFIRATVVVTSAYGDKVAFAKTSRGSTYRDSRTPKKNISEAECRSELMRLLDDSHMADRAFLTLCV